MIFSDWPWRHWRQVRDIYQFTGDNVNLGEWSSSNLNVFIPVIEFSNQLLRAKTTIYPSFLGSSNTYTLYDSFSYT